MKPHCIFKPILILLRFLILGDLHARNVYNVQSYRLLEEYCFHTESWNKIFLSLIESSG